MLVEAEEAFGKRTPWNSADVLGHLVKKSLRDTDTIDWIVSCVNDLVLNQVVLSQQLTIAQLTGKGQGGKGSRAQISQTL